MAARPRSSESNGSALFEKLRKETRKQLENARDSVKMPCDKGRNRASSVVVVVDIVVFLDGSAVASSARIKLLTVLVSDLTTALSTTVLSALVEALVKIGTDDALVELCAANVLQAVESVLVGVVLDKAETARGLLEAVQAHDQALDFAAL